MPNNRIALFTRLDLRYYGGGERTVIDLANGLKNNGIDSVIITQIDGIEKRVNLKFLLESSKVEIVQYPCIRVPLTFDVIPLSLRPYRLLKSCSSVFTLDMSFLQNLILMVISKLGHKKHIIALHDPDPYVFRNSVEGGLIKKFLFRVYRYFARITLKMVKYIQVLNRTDAIKLREIGYSGEIHYIPTLIENIHHHDLLELDTFSVLFVGRLDPQTKGIDLLKEIISDFVSENKEVVFNVVGSGPGIQLLLPLSKEHPNQVILHGFVTEETLRSLYSGSKLFISTSRVESLSLVVMEAQSYGLPVVSFDIPGPRDIIENHYQGVLIDQFDIDAFVDAINRYYWLYQSNKQDYAANRHIIMDHIVSTYGKESILPRFIELLTHAM